MSQQKIFVYGSLMEGFWNYDRSLNGHILSNETAFVKGKLYHLAHKGFPALLPGDEWIQGELMLVEDYEELFPILSEIEGFIAPNHPDNEYNLTNIKVYDTQKNYLETVPFYDYLVENDPEFTSQAVYIPSGNWRIFMVEKESNK